MKTLNNERKCEACGSNHPLPFILFVHEKKKLTVRLCAMCAKTADINGYSPIHKGRGQI